MSHQHQLLINLLQVFLNLLKSQQPKSQLSHKLLLLVHFQPPQLLELHKKVPRKVQQQALGDPQREVPHREAPHKRVPKRQLEEVPPQRLQQQKEPQKLARQAVQQSDLHQLRMIQGSLCCLYRKRRVVVRLILHYYIVIIQNLILK